MRRRIRRRAAPAVRRCPRGGARDGAKQRLAETGGLMVGGARDPAETRAEARAARALSAPPPLVRRKCESCAAEEARRSAPTPVIAPGAGPAPAPKAALGAVAAMPAGRPLSARERGFYEPRLGADLSGVRLHEDAAADRAARAMDARAFTLGRDVAFAAGERRRGGPALMAHELAHAAEEGMPAMPAVRRMVRVIDHDEPITRPGGKGLDQTKGETIQSYLEQICIFGSPKVDAKGEVSLDRGLCDPKAKLRWSGCDCLCELTAPESNDWRVHVRDSPEKESSPHTLADAPSPTKSSKSGGSGGRVVVPSPNDPKEYGAATKSGKIRAFEPWEILAHELCGHARLRNKGTHPPEDAEHVRHGHEVVVPMANKIREENIFTDLPERGSRIQDPYCGESWSRKKGAGKWIPSSHLNDCIRKRQEYLVKMQKLHPKDARFQRVYKLSEKMP